MSLSLAQLLAEYQGRAGELHEGGHGEGGEGGAGPTGVKNPPAVAADAVGLDDPVTVGDSVQLRLAVDVDVDRSGGVVVQILGPKARGASSVAVRHWRPAVVTLTRPVVLVARLST